MYIVGIVLLIFSYSLYFLGVTHNLYSIPVAIITVITIISLVAIFFLQIRHLRIPSIGIISKVILGIILLQIIINLIGALGPELAFDALWYHLTIPKLFIQMNGVEHIQGGLYYYSDMPKLIDMFYIPALLFSNEIVAKVIHFSFGIVSIILLYTVARKFLSIPYALLVVLVFYSNLVVGWESTTAYIDLGRTFYELLGFSAFIDWVEKRDFKILLLSAVFIGCAVSTKLLSVGSLFMFFILINFMGFQRKNLSYFFLQSIIFACISLLIVSPYLVFSYLHTGNPVYPFFTSLYPIVPNISSNFPKDFFSLLLFSADPINPIYLISIPLIFYVWKRFKKKEIIIFLYCFLSLIITLHTPQTGGGRFIMAYLPVISLLTGIIINLLPSLNFKTYMIALCIFIAIVSVGYRGVANARYVPVLLGNESKSNFLSNHLNFNFGDFYDVDGYIKKNIRNNDKILIVGGHNLYYIDAPFVHESAIKKGDSFNYIMVIDGVLPSKFNDAQLIHTENITHMKLYKEKKGDLWRY